MAEGLHSSVSGLGVDGLVTVRFESDSAWIPAWCMHSDSMHGLLIAILEGRLSPFLFDFQLLAMVFILPKKHS